MPHLCPGRKHAIRKEDSKVATQIQSGDQFGHIQPTRSIVLVLNLTTGHVSPQFHVKFDPKFQTVRKAIGNLAPHSEWQVECGFKPRRRNDKKKLTPRAEEAKEDHQQVQREEVED
jgi:hypothetical protein